MGSAEGALPDFVPRVVEFPNNISYQLLQPLINFKSCHDGTPAESRSVFTCKRIIPSRESDNDAPSGDTTDTTGSGDDAEFVVKIKVQIAHNYLGTLQEPQSEPSTTTTAEIKALTTFNKANNPYVPTLIAFKQEVQNAQGILPGGYITYTVMTKLPGGNLFDLHYWSIPAAERSLIVDAFWKALQSLFELGVEPIDRGLRNVLWDKDSGRCSIVDFEVWREVEEEKEGERRGPERTRTHELQRWGLERRPPPQDWWGEWHAHMR